MSAGQYLAWLASLRNRLKAPPYTGLAQLMQFEVDEVAYTAIADATDHGNTIAAKAKRSLAALDAELGVAMAAT